MRGSSDNISEPRSHDATRARAVNAWEAIGRLVRYQTLHAAALHFAVNAVEADMPMVETRARAEGTPPQSGMGDGTAHRAVAHAQR